MRRALLGLIVLLGASCETPPQEPETYASPPIESTPLAHDPTEAFEIGRWWTNGLQLLRLDPERSFALFDSLNRYQPPHERGVWSQQSYAVMWLEPYSILPRERVRVTITRTDGELTLVIPRLKPMHAIEAPPAVVEDGLIGTWRAPHGTLEIRRDRRYAFSPNADLTPEEVPLVGHRGRWRLDGRKLLLRPDALALDLLSFTLVTEGDEVRLVSPDGDFVPEHDENLARGNQS